MKKAAIDISTAKPKAKPSAKPKRPKKHKLEPGQHPAEVTPVFSEQQKRVLDLLATGCSMAAAAEAVSYTHWALQKWMQRDEVFHYYADRARGIHTSDIYDAFHEVETDARVLLQEIIRDHDVAPHIRLRAALAALNRKEDAWLPRTIHVGAPLAPPQGAEPYTEGELESSDDRFDQKRGEQSDAGQTEAEPSGWAHTETSRKTQTGNHTTLIQPASGKQSDATQSRASGQMKVAGARSERNERRPTDNQPSEARPSQPPLAQNVPGPTLAAPSQQPHETDTRHLAPDTSAKRGEAFRLGHHADKTAPHADKTKSIHLTANQALPPKTANFRPPEVSANADKTSATAEPSDSGQTETEPSGWAHTATSRRSQTGNDTTLIQPASGEPSDAAQSRASGRVMVAGAHSERSLRRPQKRARTIRVAADARFV